MQLIELRLPEDADWQFAAGQYLEVIVDDTTTVPLSIASSPAQLPVLMLHYRSTPGSADAEAFDSLLASTGGNARLTLRGPAGDICISPDEDRPLLLICGGTGAAQALAIIADVALQGPERDVTLLACADRDEDFYFRNTLSDYKARWLNTVYIADANRDSRNRGLRWLVDNAAHYTDRRVIICGSPPFVYAVEDALNEAGQELPLESDVFAYAPR